MVSATQEIRSRGKAPARPV